MSVPTACSPFLAQLILSALNTGETLGALAIGIPLTAIAYGITLCQAFDYYRLTRVKQDPWYLKTFVGTLMALVTFQQALLFNTLYDYLASHYDDPCVFLQVKWPTPVATLISGIIGLCVNGFLTNRVWMLGRNVYVTLFCALATAANFGTNLASDVQVFINPSALEQVTALQTSGIAGWAVAIVADSSIVISIVFYLYRSRTGMRRSNDMISRLMLLTVSTGFLTTCVALIGLILYAIFPSSFYPAIVEFMVGKFYLNSLLTTLNMRDTISREQSESTSNFMNSIPLSDTSSTRWLKTGSKAVNVEIDRAVAYDDYSRHSDHAGSANTAFSTKKPGSEIC